jgi:glycosyltransferase involved in cell wall biosynthesis
MSTPVKLSVVTVCRNAAPTIEDTLRSVAAQTYPEVEHIVVDGGSTDGTLDIIQRHRSRIATLISEPDRGIYDAMNKGIAAATGDIVGTLNADDFYVDAHVLGKIAHVFADPAVAACYADLVYVDRRDLNRVVRYWKSCPYADGLFEKGWLPAHPTFFVRRELYRRFGSFDLRYRYQADFELTMRLLAVHKQPTVYLPEVIVKMRMGGVSNRNVLNVIKGNLEAYRACRQHGLKVSPLFIVRKVLSRLPQFFRRAAGV